MLLQELGILNFNMGDFILEALELGIHQLDLLFLDIYTHFGAESIQNAGVCSIELFLLFFKSGLLVNDFLLFLI